MKKSPMLIHSIESFQHGIEHYVDGEPKGRKFAILHIDHSIELLLKEKVVTLGNSLYKTDGQTLSFHESINSLKDTKLPEKARLQEIHDLRNTIQHKGITPDESTTEFYIEVAYEFFKRFSVDELGLTVDDILPARFIRLMEKDRIWPDYDYIPSVNFNQHASPVENIINAYTVLNQYVKGWQAKNKDLDGFRKTIMTLASENGYSREEVKQKLKSIMTMKNDSSHSEYQPSSDELRIFIDEINELIYMMGAKKD